MVESKGIPQEDLEKSAKEILDRVKGNKLDSQELDRVLEELLTLHKTIPAESLQGPLRELVRQAVDTTLSKQSFELDQLGKRQELIEISAEMKKKTAGVEKPMENLEKIENFVKSDPLLKAIFTGVHKRKVSALNKIGESRSKDNFTERPFYFKSLEHFETIIKNSLAESLNVEREALPENVLKLKDFSMWVILNFDDIDNNLKKIKQNLEINLDVYADIKDKPAKKPIEAEPAPAQPAKGSVGMAPEEQPKPPTPSPEKIEESRNQAKERERKEFNEKLTALEKRLDGSNKENFNEWKRLMNAINKSEDALKTALKKRNRKFEFIMGRKPILALMNSFSKKEKEQVSEDNIGDRLRQKLAEISKIVGEEKEKLAPKKPIKPAPEKAGAKAEEQESFGDRAERLAPKEYTAWKKLFIALHYGDPDVDYPSGYMTAEDVLSLIGVNASVDIEKLQDAIRDHGWGFYLDVKVPSLALKAILQKKKATDENLGELTKDATKEIMALVKRALTTFEPKLLHRPPPDIGQRPPKPTLPPAPPGAPSEANVFREASEKASENEKVFYNLIKKYTEDKPEEHERFHKALQLMQIDSDDPEVKALQNKIKSLLEVSMSTIDPATKTMPAPLIDDLLSSLKTQEADIAKQLDAHQKESESKEKKAQDKSKKETLVNLYYGEMEAEFGKIYSILETDLETIKDERTKRFVKDTQMICQKFLDGIDDTQLKDLDLDGQQALAKTLKANFETQLKNHIEKLEEKTNLTETLKKAAPGKAPEAKKAPETGARISLEEEVWKGEIETEKGKKGWVQETRETVGNVLSKDKEKVKGIFKGKEKLDPDVEKLLKSILRNKELVDPNNPICQAINQFILDNEINLNDLKNFLLNPDLLDKSFTDADRQRIEAEMQTQGAANYQDLIKKLKRESNEKDRFLKSNTGHRASKEIEEDKKIALARITEIEDLMDLADLAIQLEDRTASYKSPRHVLALINFFHGGTDMSIEEHNENIKAQIETQKNRLYSGPRSWLNVLAYPLRPTLGSTLKAMAKDKEFAKLGDDPAKEMAKLVKWFHLNPMKVKEWVENLPGGFEQHIKSTVPRLIAYLEIAIRDGNIRTLLNTGDAEKLVDMLKKVQHDYILDEIEEKNSDLTNKSKMLLYFQKLKEFSKKGDDINKKILARHVLKAQAKKIGLVGGGAAVALTYPLLALASLPGIAAIPTLLASYSKKMKEEHRPIARRSAARMLAANALALGGATLGGLTIGLPLAVLGVFAPEIWKHREPIYKKGKPVAEFTATKILPTAIKVPWWIVKYTAGLPLVAGYRFGKQFLGK